MDLLFLDPESVLPLLSVLLIRWAVLLTVDAIRAEDCAMFGVLRIK